MNCVMHHIECNKNIQSGVLFFIELLLNKLKKYVNGFIGFHAYDK